MTFRLSPEAELFRESMRSLCADKVAVNAAGADREAQFPWPSWQALVDLGISGLTLPEQFGGSGADAVTWAIAIEEIAGACAATAVTALVHGAASGLINRLGTQEQRERYLPSAARGEVIVAFAQSEAHAGSDVAAISCQAQQDGNGWRLNGHKTWVSSAGIANLYLVFAKTDPSAGAKGISIFLVPATTPGLTVGKLEDKMGLRGSPTGELILDKVSLGPDALLGEVNHGWSGSMSFLSRSRPTVGAQAVGVAQAAFDTARQYVKEREAFGQRVGDFQAIQFMLADMDIGITTARTMVYHAADMIEAGGKDSMRLAAIAKTYATDMAMKVTTDAVQLLGGAGYVKDFPVERHMRDAKVFQIYEGTNQIQRWVIGRNLLDN